MKEIEHGCNRNSKKLSGVHPKDGKGLIQAVRFPPGADNRTRRRADVKADMEFERGG